MVACGAHRERGEGELVHGSLRRTPRGEGELVHGSLRCTPRGEGELVHGSLCCGDIVLLP